MYPVDLEGIRPPKSRPTALSASRGCQVVYADALLKLGGEIFLFLRPAMRSNNGTIDSAQQTTSSLSNNWLANPPCQQTFFPGAAVKLQGSKFTQMGEYVIISSMPKPPEVETGAGIPMNLAVRHTCCGQTKPRDEFETLHNVGFLRRHRNGGHAAAEFQG